MRNARRRHDEGSVVRSTIRSKGSDPNSQLMRFRLNRCCAATHPHASWQSSARWLAGWLALVCEQRFEREREAERCAVDCARWSHSLASQASCCCKCTSAVKLSEARPPLFLSLFFYPVSVSPAHVQQRAGTVVKCLNSKTRTNINCSR